jgi:DNA polymerase-3 subunit alpha
LLDPASLREKSYRELHVRMESPVEAGNYEERNLTTLRDLIYSIPGQCSLYFHIPLQGRRKEALLRAGAHITCSALERDLENLRSHPLVNDVWRD